MLVHQRVSQLHLDEFKNVPDSMKSSLIISAVITIIAMCHSIVLSGKSGLHHNPEYQSWYFKKETWWKQNGIHME